MADDEINDVRRVRHRISAEHDHDVKKLVAHYQAFEKKLAASGRFRFAGEAKEFDAEIQDRERHVTKG